MKKEEKQNVKPEMKTLGSSMKTRLEYIEKRERSVASEIDRVHKKIDAVPKLEKRLEELKVRQKKLAEQRDREIKDLQELTSQFVTAEVIGETN
jgi:chaperonin cofactor prefoldin